MMNGWKWMPYETNCHIVNLHGKGGEINVGVVLSQKKGKIQALPIAPVLTEQSVCRH